MNLRHGQLWQRLGLAVLSGVRCGFAECTKRGV